MTNVTADLVFLFDVDNTLLDNDRVQADLRDHLEENFGRLARDRYWELLEQLRGEIGYVDYLGAIERFRLEKLHDPRILKVASWLVDYPFRDRLYHGVLDVVWKARQRGTTVVLSDGDAVFQPRKVERSGLWQEFGGNVLIYVHKERELADVAHWYPAKRYVLIDDKLRILSAVKAEWGDRVTTVLVRQGHYALDPKEIASYPAADVTIEKIRDLARADISLLSGSGPR